MASRELGRSVLLCFSQEPLQDGVIEPAYSSVYSQVGNEVTLSAEKHIQGHPSFLADVVILRASARQQNTVACHTLAVGANNQPISLLMTRQENMAQLTRGYVQVVDSNFFEPGIIPIATHTYRHPEPIPYISQTQVSPLDLRLPLHFMPLEIPFEEVKLVAVQSTNHDEGIFDYSLAAPGEELTLASVFIGKLSVQQEACQECNLVWTAACKTEQEAHVEAFSLAAMCCGPQVTL